MLLRNIFHYRTFVHAKMIPVETIPGIRQGRDKGEQ
jgi:hypothetical protein